MSTFVSIFLIIIHFLVASLLNYKLYQKEINFFIVIGVPLFLSIFFSFFIIILERYRNDEYGIIFLTVLTSSELLFFTVTWLILLYN